MMCFVRQLFKEKGPKRMGFFTVKIPYYFMKNIRNACRGISPESKAITIDSVKVCK